MHESPWQRRQSNGELSIHPKSRIRATGGIGVTYPPENSPDSPPSARPVSAGRCRVALAAVHEPERLVRGMRSSLAAEHARVRRLPLDFADRALRLPKRDWRPPVVAPDVRHEPDECGEVGRLCGAKGRLSCGSAPVTQR
ncbi:Hypothetical protein NTJ_01698 [Nesidiocoris tenuis]|uniref:Uncharacterized protein n=1 Tax=Nesidiocoris tenuis TaxID=355587 RepID=A0ABN7ADF9_9HEMI|nr:Hypothetical protein NTJ_01698 [Nesidiocoris tenuis]